MCTLFFVFHIKSNKYKNYTYNYTYLLHFFLFDYFIIKHVFTNKNVLKNNIYNLNENKIC